MGYFSYFIKCLIRNFAKALFNKKSLLLIIAIFCVFFVFQNVSRAEFTSADSQMITTINGNINYLARQLESLNTRVDTLLQATDDNVLYTELWEIHWAIESLHLNLNNTLDTVNSNLDVISAKLETINNNINYISGQIVTVANTLDTIEQNLDTINLNINVISAQLETVNTNINYMARLLETINSNLASLVEESNDLLEEQNQLQQEQNNLQQEQNNLQQEQNDFMQQETQDSSIDVNGFNNVESNDVTSSGLSSVFMNIYNSISSWSSKDINLPIPYTNKNIVIPANYTSNMLNSVGGGWIITFISSIYYFVVARFIIYSITGIINSIKSGSILETDSKDNITTDML